ncbi:MAG: uroporphyrinogen-III synthase [Rhabdochlamydiaceae bacterium]
MERRPLQGLTVAITSSRRATELGHLIEAFGGKAYLAPTVGIQVSAKDTANQVRRFLELTSEDTGVDIAIFMTGPGTESIISASKELGLEVKLLKSLRSTPLVVARSAKPRSVLAKYHIQENVKLPKVATFEGILELLRDSISLMGKRIVLFWHGDRSEVLSEALRNLGANIFEFSTYSYSNELSEDGANLLKSAGFESAVLPQRQKVEKLIEDIIAGKIDVITFTSPPSVKNLFETAKIASREEKLRRELDLHVLVASIGPSTSETLIQYGVRPDVVPEIYKMGKMVESLAEYLKGWSAKKKARHA